jgi:hypothetical protein
MNAEIKDQWGAWLLEHADEQGVYALRQETVAGDRFCCLGGLCDLAVAAGIVVRAFNEATRKYGYYVEGELHPEPETGTLPRAVYQWAGLPDSNPVVSLADSHRASLAELNDQGYRFPSIWRLISEQL